MAAACGISNATIKMLGRWECSAYSLYIKTPRAQLASIIPKLATGGQTGHSSLTTPIGLLLGTHANVNFKLVQVCNESNSVLV